MMLGCFGGDSKDAASIHEFQAGCQISMYGEAGPFVVIQPGTPQLPVTQIESQRPDQMQLCTGVGAQADDITSVGGDFRLVENDLEHIDRCSNLFCCFVSR